MASRTLWQTIDAFGSKLDASIALFDKGYPEFDESQPRDAQGRWSGGGGSRGWSVRGGRVRSTRALTYDDFKRLARRSDVKPHYAIRDAKLIHIQAVDPGFVLETHWEGKETSNTAKEGDVLVTTLGRNHKALIDSDGNPNQYLISRESLERLYEPARDKVGPDGTLVPDYEGGPIQIDPRLGQIWRRKGDSVVLAMHFGGGFDIVAPWGERQRAKRGYLLWNGKDVYGNHYGTFNATYKWISDAEASRRTRTKKGYPEFNPDQARGEDGRWTSGGGSSAAVRQPRTRGSKPGGSKLSKPARAKHKKIKDSAVKAQKAAEDMIAARHAAEERERFKRFEDALKRTADEVWNTPPEVWAEPTFADAVWNTLTDLWVATGVAISAATGNFWLSNIYGMSLAVTGLYRMMRHVYRKMTIPGYRGVRKPWEDDILMAR